MERWQKQDADVGGKSRQRRSQVNAGNAPAAVAAVHSRCGPSLTTVEDIKGRLGSARVPSRGILARPACFTGNLTASGALHCRS